MTETGGYVEHGDTYTVPVVVARAVRGGDYHVHKAGCGDLRKPGKYDSDIDGPYPVGTRGEELVNGVYDNGILDETISRLATEKNLSEEDAYPVAVDELGEQFTYIGCVGKVV